MSILSVATEYLTEAKELPRPERLMFVAGMGALIQCVLPYVHGGINTELQVLGRILALTLEGKSEGEIQTSVRELINSSRS